MNDRELLPTDGLISSELRQPVKIPLPPIQHYREHGGNTQVLRQKSLSVDISTKEGLIAAQTTIKLLWYTMRNHGGIGMAAPQIGKLERILVIDGSENQDYKQAITMINPEILYRSHEKVKCDEGCLSFPGVSALVERSKVVQVHYWDGNGEEQLLGFEDLLAVAVQHEIDHLNSVLFIDHLSRLVRTRLLTQYRKKTASRPV